MSNAVLDWNFDGAKFVAKLSVALTEQYVVIPNAHRSGKKWTARRVQLGKTLWENYETSQHKAKERCEVHYLSSLVKRT